MTYRAGSERGVREYERDYLQLATCRKIVGQYAEWIKLFPWKLFCTFTFSRRVFDEKANNVFADFINQLERFLGCDVGYVRGDEKRFSGCGKPACGRHFHVLLTSAAPMTSGSVEQLWKSVAGGWSDDTGALVLLFDPALRGVSYVLKLINQLDGDWDFRNLHLFHPGGEPEFTHRRFRRRMRRHIYRTNLFLRTQVTTAPFQMVDFSSAIDCTASMGPRSDSSGWNGPTAYISKSEAEWVRPYCERLKAVIEAASHRVAEGPDATHESIRDVNDLQQRLKSPKEAHGDLQTDEDLIRLALERNDVEDTWVAAISAVTPEYTKRLTKKELSRLCTLRKDVGAELFQRVVRSVVQRWDKWVLEDDKGTPCTADPGRPPVRYLIRCVEVAGLALKDRVSVSNETLEAYMDWLNSPPGVLYPL
jgi:hypothetical protein